MKKTYKYYRISMSETSITTWIYAGTNPYPDWTDFELEMECPFVRAYIEEIGEPTESNKFIHAVALAGIRRAMKMGYEVSFINKPEEK